MARTRPFSLLLAAAALLLGGSSQGSRIYGQARPAASGPGSFVAVGSAFSMYRNPYGLRNQEGHTFSVDVNPTWRYGLDAEYRSLSMNSDEGVTLANYFTGLRVAVLPGRISPYGKFLVGAGHIAFPFHYAQGTYFAYVPGGGVDLKLNDRLAVRTDFEYQMWQDFTFGAFHPYGASVGLNVRLNGIRHAPKHAYDSRW